MFELILLAIILCFFALEIYYLRKANPGKYYMLKARIMVYKALLNRTFGRWKLFRMVSGGVWVYFDSNELIRTKWVNKDYGLILHPEGGIFSNELSNIIWIENWWGGNEDKS